MPAPIQRKNYSNISGTFLTLSAAAGLGLGLWVVLSPFQEYLEGIEYDKTQSSLGFGTGIVGLCTTFGASTGLFISMLMTMLKSKCFPVPPARVRERRDAPNNLEKALAFILSTAIVFTTVQSILNTGQFTRYYYNFFGSLHSGNKSLLGKITISPIVGCTSGLFAASVWLFAHGVAATPALLAENFNRCVRVRAPEAPAAITDQSAVAPTGSPARVFGSPEAPDGTPRRRPQNQSGDMVKPFSPN